jgi:hypothetical protein
MPNRILIHIFTLISLCFKIKSYKYILKNIKGYCKVFSKIPIDNQKY